MRYLLTIIVLFLCQFTVQAEINGPVGCNAGTVIALKSDRSVAWYVYPPCYSNSFIVSDDCKTAYFASTKPGKITFFTCTPTYGGDCIIEQHSFYNGLNIPDR